MINTKTKQRMEFFPAKTLKKEVKRIAKWQGISASQFITDALTHYINYLVTNKKG